MSLSRPAARAFGRASLLALMAVAAARCGGDSNPNTPTPQPVAQTRIIGLSGNLAFGEVAVGSERTATLTIANTGNQPLTVSQLNISSSLSSHTTTSWSSGTIAAGGSQAVTIAFRPTAAGTYSGTLSVTADHTSGTSNIPVSGTAVQLNTFTGRWNGDYVVERCEGTGSLQDLLCSANRGAFPPGTALPLALDLTQNGSTVTGTLAQGQVTGPVTGTVDSTGTLTLRGTATNGQLSIQLSAWSTRVQGNVMEGNFTWNATITGVPGVGVVVSRLGRVTK
jgi:hypothetical protein